MLPQHTKRPTEWRPCCGNCRSERLKPVEHGWRCEDCGAEWDGSELTVEEAADRPPRAPGSARAAPDDAQAPAPSRRNHGAI